MSKVVIVSNIPAPYRVDLFCYMQENCKEHDFRIIYTNKNEDNRVWSIDDEKLENKIILNSNIIKIKGKLDYRYIHLPKKLDKVLKNLNPDVVIASEYNLAAIQSLLWTKKNKRKFIHLTDGTIYSERNISLLQKISRKFICKYADAYIASSTKAKEKLVVWGINPKSIFISLLTVDISIFLKEFDAVDLENNKKIILYVGSLIHRKGVDLLLNALPYIKQEYCLRIVGNGANEEIELLKKQAKKLGISKKIIFAGFKQKEKLVEEYKNATVFVLPTREDCFGLVLVEALCALKPIVASKYADGVYDIVENGINGYIINPYDSKMLAKSIQYILDEKRIYCEFSEKNKIKRKKFFFSEVISGYLDAIDYALRIN